MFYSHELRGGGGRFPSPQTKRGKRERERLFTLFFEEGDHAFPYHCIVHMSVLVATTVKNGVTFFYFFLGGEGTMTGEPLKMSSSSIGCAVYSEEDFFSFIFIYIIPVFQVEGQKWFRLCQYCDCRSISTSGVTFV